MAGVMLTTEIAEILPTFTNNVLAALTTSSTHSHRVAPPRTHNADTS